MTTPISDALNLSDSMRKALLGARMSARCLTVNARVSHQGTRDALLRRGASIFEGMHIALDVALTMAAVELRTQVGEPEFLAERIDRDLDVYGSACGGDYAATESVLWSRVRAGDLEASKARVPGIGHYYDGWEFRPTNPTQVQLEASARVAAEVAALPEWRRDEMALA